VDLSKNFFQIFALPVSYDVDNEKLMDSYRKLQQVVHPDLFTTATDHEKRLSAEAAAYLNDGLDTLKQPVKRAIYLLELVGVNVDFENSSAMAPAFLMEQMELRELLESVAESNDPFLALDQLYERVDVLQKKLIVEFENAYAQGDSESLQLAANVVAEMQFVEKLRLDIEHLEELLDETA